ncbi:MAG: hypothetical protein Q7R58_02160 [bacterium]|nr:hypothetical protein [bacterium]
MKDTCIIIRSSKNETPEKKIATAIAPLVAKGFRVVSATTVLTPHGAWAEGVRIGATEIAEGSAKHLYYATTVVLEKS